MAQRSYQFSYQNVEVYRNEENTLGIGSYGAVYRAKCDELPCAAKCLHPVFFQFNDPGMLDAIRKFEQECHFLSTVRHPNIIQYLGMIRDPDSGRPVLLMELMDESLTRFLERQNRPLPYHVQVNLVYDIALALAYLHSNGMVHRDLSSNNVLLIAGSRAKVTDFGMSKLITVNPRMTPLTQCPGTLVFMAPEALTQPPVYSEKLDCFSEGVLIVQIITRLFPDPGPATRMLDDPRSPVGALQVPIPESERRHSHIVLIDPAHPLLQIALRCLEYRQQNRPSARELCRHVSALKEAPQYAKSVQHASERGQSAATEGEGQYREVIEQLERQNQDLQEQLHHRDERLQEKDVAIASSHRNIQQLRQEVQQNDQVIKARERQLQELNQQLKTSEQVTAEFQRNLLQKERLVRDLEERLATKDREIQELQQRQNSRRTGGESIQLTWRESGKAQRKMYRGAVAVEGSVAYFRPHGSEEVHTYNSEKEEWSQLPDCPYLYFSLAVVNGMVTTVGGRDSTGKDINTLLSLAGQGRDRKWVELFPPMPTKRYGTTAAYNGRNLIVAGGATGMWPFYKTVSTVEVMDTENLQWYTATNLPDPLSHATATIYGDKAYLLGGEDLNYSPTKSVLTCSLTALLQTCQPQSLGDQLQKTLTLEHKPSIWRTIADIPVYQSTCTTLRGELVAVGGYESDYKRKTTAVYQYSPSTDSWQVISHMKRARSQCFVTVLPNNKLIIVGGYTHKIHRDVQTDLVEVATAL